MNIEDFEIAESINKQIIESDVKFTRLFNSVKRLNEYTSKAEFEIEVQISISPLTILHINKDELIDLLTTQKEIEEKRLASLSKRFEAL